VRQAIRDAVAAATVRFPELGTSGGPVVSIPAVKIPATIKITAPADKTALNLRLFQYSLRAATIRSCPLVARLVAAFVDFGRVYMAVMTVYRPFTRPVPAALARRRPRQRHFLVMGAAIGCRTEIRASFNVAMQPQAPGRR
jgi:hypothetical protein